MKSHLVFSAISAAALTIIFSASASANGLQCTDLFSTPSKSAASERTKSNRKLSVSKRTTELTSNLQEITTAKELFESIMELRNEVKEVREKNGAWEPWELLDRRLKSNLLQAFILNGETDLVVRHFQVLYEPVEFGFQKVRISCAIVDKLKRDKKAGRIDAEFAQAEIERWQSEADLSRDSVLANFEMYEPLRTIIDRISADGEVQDTNAIVTHLAGDDAAANAVNSTTAANQSGSAVPASAGRDRVMQTALDADHRLGSYMQVEAVQNFFAAAQKTLGKKFRIERPTAEELNSFYNYEINRTEATIVRLRRELQMEKRLRLKLMFLGPQLYEILLTLVSRLPVPLQKMTTTVLMFGQDAGLRRRHLSNVNRIMQIPSEGVGIDGRTRLEELRRLNTTYPNDELLNFYVRTVNGTRTWDSMKAQAQELAKSSNVWASFVRRMEVAEKNGEGRDLNLFEDIPASAVAGAVVRLGIVSSGYYIVTHPKFNQLLDSLLALASHAASGKFGF